MIFCWCLLIRFASSSFSFGSWTGDSTSILTNCSWSWMWSCIFFVFLGLCGPRIRWANALDYLPQGGFDKLLRVYFSCFLLASSSLLPTHGQRNLGPWRFSYNAPSAAPFSRLLFSYTHLESFGSAERAAVLQSRGLSLSFSLPSEPAIIFTFIHFSKGILLLLTLLPRLESSDKGNPLHLRIFSDQAFSLQELWSVVAESVSFCLAARFLW